MINSFNSQDGPDFKLKKQNAAAERVNDIRYKHVLVLLVLRYKCKEKHLKILKE